MAEIKPFPNVVDADWMLSEETGKLRAENVRVVAHSPKQRLFVESVLDPIPQELMDRYQRLAYERQRRGIKEGK